MKNLFLILCVAILAGCATHHASVAPVVHAPPLLPDANHISTHLKVLGYFIVLVIAYFAIVIWWLERSPVVKEKPETLDEAKARVFAVIDGFREPPVGTNNPPQTSRPNPPPPPPNPIAKIRQKSTRQVKAEAKRRAK